MKFDLIVRAKVLLLLVTSIFSMNVFYLTFLANGTETVAVPQPDGSYKLHGYKWFSSATDADMTFTLARVIGHDGRVIQVSERISSKRNI